MTGKLDTVKAAVNDSLYDESKPWYTFFSWAEVQTGVNRLNLFIGMYFKLNVLVYLLMLYKNNI